MLNDLRNQATFEPDDEEEQPLATKPEKPKPPRPKISIDKMTGTTDRQRLMLAVMLFVMVCLLGSLFLIITGKVVIPTGG